jgi:uncharacterized caspase-like protein
VSAGRHALLVATYEHRDPGLSRLTAPAHDAEALAEVLKDPEMAGFDVTMLINQPHHVVGEAIADFFAERRRNDLTLLYFTGHGVKDDEGRLYLAMANTRRDALMFTSISAAQVNDAMDACRSHRKVLVLDCCYSGAFPAGRAPKSDDTVQTLERFQGKGRAVLTASDATQYAFEGDDLRGSGTQSLFTRYLVEAIRTGEADLDEDGDIALDELYSYVRDRVVAEMPQQRPKKQEDVDGRILIASNVHWKLPDHVRYTIESPISAQRLSAVEELARLHRIGNGRVRAAALHQLTALAQDDSRSVSARAERVLAQLRAESDPRAPRPNAPPAQAAKPSRAPVSAPEQESAPTKAELPDMEAGPARIPGTASVPGSESGRAYVSPPAQGAAPGHASPPPPTPAVEPGPKTPHEVPASAPWPAARARHDAETTSSAMTDADAHRRDQIKTTFWRVRQSVWLLVPLLGAGLLTWVAFLYVGQRTHRRPWLVSSAVYGLAAVAVVVMISTSPVGSSRPIDAIGGLVIILMWLGGFVHALVINPRYLTMLAQADDSAPSPRR